jgi:hypothetical protein
MAVLDPLLGMVWWSAEVLSPDRLSARLDDGGRLDPTAHKVGRCCEVLCYAHSVTNDSCCFI